MINTSICFATWALTATVGPGPLPASEAGPPRLFGLVVGTNVSRDPTVPPLRYADDDAIQNGLLLTELGAQVLLLVDRDFETRQLFSGIHATPPTGAALDAALTKLNGWIDSARAAGHPTVLFFFYSGHGDVENNEGYINLQDRRFWRADLQQLLRRSHATTNHVVIDACKSYFLVFQRGAGGSRTPVHGPLIPPEEDVPANTGLFLSTSAAVDSHEWEAFQGGIFSHELRSAMRGAADLDRDGALTYEEAAAFVWAANATIPNARFRPDFYARPPGAAPPEHAVLVRLQRASGGRLVVGPGVADHLYLEDGQGLRLADFRPGPDQQLELLVPHQRPLFVRQVDSNREVALPPGDRLVLAVLPVSTAEVIRRGAAHVAFSRLFSRPFDPTALAAYRDRPPASDRGPIAATDPTWLRRGLGIGGLGAGVAGGILTSLALSARRDVTSQTHGRDRHQINQRIHRFNTGAVICYAIAGAGLAAYLTWTLWPAADVELDVLSPDQPMARLSLRMDL